ncbi:heme o synthase [Glycomyces buryatensis]|uniref:Protoheme IX farnesyltransferase n=1 Tax=Glycomyces buryatensis TaxID=2570927 RepID=A0A4S8Q3C5_9ACTN|nr:heme o synthase [Glycomyces buryatensis]THV38510.1 protoheme IX farnesyltransferase [Glycomyces buryatensis]
MNEHSTRAAGVAPQPEAPKRIELPAPDDADTPPPSLRTVIGAYVSLTKPRIIELLLVTTIPTMLVAARLENGGLPGLLEVIATFVGGALAAGSANAINCYIDRDIDKLMRRTNRRPLARHEIPPRNALIFGLVIGAVAVVGMGLLVNLLAAALTFGAIVYYDVVYTIWLKRTTPYNTVWGGACGAAPILIGWAAVTGHMSWMAWVLFAIVFLWQPPHFYVLAMKFKDDYAAAGIPMLPAVAPAKRVAVESVVYGWLTLAVSLVAVPLGATWLYGSVALVTGAMFVWECHKLLGRVNRGEDPKPMRLFHWSTSYLTLLFLALAIDSFLM